MPEPSRAAAHRLLERTKVALAAAGTRLGRVLPGARTRNSELERLALAGLCLGLIALAMLTSIPSAANEAAAGSGSPVPVVGPGGASARTDPTAEPSGPAGSASYPGDGSIANVLEDQMPEGDARALLQKYTVQSGDTLARIAIRFGLDPTTIYWANRSSLPDPQSLRVGQVLMIPPIDGLLVVVGPGESLASIATRYGVAAQDIVDVNSLSNSAVLLGQALLVPGAEAGPIPVVREVRLASSRGGGASGSSSGWNGHLIWPVPGHTQINQRFGCTGDPAEPRVGGCAHFHDAIDIGAPAGAAVVAAGPGTVIYAGWKLAGSDGYGGGLVVWISHGGKLYTTYNHLSAEFVRVGQQVGAGQRIGSVGMTGAATGPHLHFEVWACYPWSDGTTSCARNPLAYVR